MGHRLSHLRGVFGEMENRDCSLPPTGDICNRDAANGNPPYVEMGGSSSNSRIINCQNNGNAEGVLDFESIYSNTLDNINTYSNTEYPRDETTGTNCLCAIKLESVDKTKVGPKNSEGFKRGTHRTLSFGSGKKSRSKTLRSTKEPSICGNKKKLNHWVLKFNCTRFKGSPSCSTGGSSTDIPEPNISCPSCVCTGYRRTEEHHLGAGVVFESRRSSSRRQSIQSDGSSDIDEGAVGNQPDLIDMSKFNPEDYPIEDCDERARLERAREMAEGVEPPPGFCPGPHIQLVCPPGILIDNLTALFQTHLGIHSAALLSQLDVSVAPSFKVQLHSQVDYIHCLVPDLLQITSCSFYWGKMDRYEAERLLEGRPEGTFLLRDSAQEEYLFSVSFRKYGRSLHARIEQWNHHFSFDSHDPGVFASPTVCGLIEHYKDPSCCMFFEPLLTIPLHRTFPFPLQHLCRAVVCSRVTYDGINQLKLPKALKGYLKEYHYRQRIRVRSLDQEH